MLNSKLKLFKSIKLGSQIECLIDKLNAESSIYKSKLPDQARWNIDPDN